MTSDTSVIPSPSVGLFRRLSAVLLSLALPGAGHCLLGAFRRGLLWPLGVAIVQLLLLYIVPIAAAIWTAIAVGLAGRAAASIDAARIVRPVPTWGRVVAAWVLVVVVTSFVNVAVATPLASYYAQHHAQAFRIPTGGMEPTLLVGDSVIIDRAAYRERPPARYDIVAFAHPDEETHDAIKRIAGMPGDLVVMEGAQVSVNGELMREPYLDAKLLAATPSPGNCKYGCEPTTVPADSYFVLGDNRGNSEDSRFFGFIKREKIKGKAHSIYWSWDVFDRRFRPGRIGRLP